MWEAVTKHSFFSVAVSSVVVGLREMFCVCPQYLWLFIISKWGWGLECCKTLMLKVFKLINPTIVNWECWIFVKFKCCGGISWFESSWWTNYHGLVSPTQVCAKTLVSVSKDWQCFTSRFPHMWSVTMVQLMYSDLLVYFSQCTCFGWAWLTPLEICKGMQYLGLNWMMWLNKSRQAFSMSCRY